jgi:outer membrane protein assembly factor BamB
MRRNKAGVTFIWTVALTLVISTLVFLFQQSLSMTVEDVGDFGDGSSTVVTWGSVYVESADGKVYCLDGQTGTKLWDYVTGNAV